MYRTDDIKTGLLNVIGWRQYYDTAEFTIADSLTVTETGQYFQDVHPLLSLDNLKAIAPDFKRITYPAWVTTTQYRVGDRVTVASTGNNYRAKIANQGTSPETAPLVWERFDPFSEWIEQKTQAGIVKAVQRFYSENIAGETAKNIVESKTLFDGCGRLSETILSTNSVVGLELIPIRAKGITLRIDKIGLQFKGQGNHVLYLMHSSRVDPVKIVELTRVRDGGMEWFEPTEEILLPYVSDDNDAGGSWFLVYDQQELPDGFEAVNKSKDWSTDPCSTCSRTEYLNWQAWSKYLEVHPFKVNNVERASDGDFNGDFNSDFFTTPIKMWDMPDQLYTYTSNYGINLQVTIECDITDIILEQRKSFQNVIGLQVAESLIREMAYNPAFRIGRSQQNHNRLELLYELDGDSQSQKPSGIVYMLKKAMEALKLDTKEMSRICFPCKNGGVKYRTV